MAKDLQIKYTNEDIERIFKERVKYGLDVWTQEQVIPLLNFLKQREEELAEYMELWKGDE